MSVANLNTVSFAGLRRQLRAAYVTKRTVVLQGPPGGGKTEGVTSFLSEMIPTTGTVWYFNGALKSPEYVGGVMFPVEGNTRCRLLIPDQWDLIKAGDCVVIDELDKVPHSNQNMWLEFAQFGTIDGKKIGSGQVLTVICANRSTDKSGSFGLSGLVGNRSKVLTFQGHPDEYVTHLATKGTHHFVMAYISENRGDIMGVYNPSELRNATARSWDNLSKELFAFGEDISLSDLLTTAAAFLPDGIAMKMSVYHELAGKLISVEEIIKNPEKAKLPGTASDRGLRFMQLHMVASHVMGLPAGPDRGKAKTALWKYAKRFPAEFRSAIMPCVTTSPVPLELVEDNEYGQWIAERKRILETGK